MKNISHLHKNMPKIEVVLCQAYRLKNRSNSSPFVPATRGEWNTLYFNPDLLDKRFELSRDNVYVPTPSLRQHLLNHLPRLLLWL